MKKILFMLALLFAAQVQAHHDGTDHGSEAADHSQHAHAAPSAILEISADVPTLSAQSDLFEVVARLYPKELGIYIDHWASNVPVLGATVEVEVNGRKAVAKFHADHGDYAVTDPDLLKTLQAEGEHALMFTISTDKDADLLTGELHVHAESALEALSARPGKWLLLGGFGIVILIGCGLAVRHLLKARKGESA